MKAQKTRKYNKLISISFLCLIAIMLLIPPSFAANTQDILKPKTKIEKKSELHNVFARFLKTMAWVLGSAFGLYVILLICKKFTNNPVTINTNIDLDKNLTSPDTIEDATKFVIKKF